MTVYDLPHVASIREIGTSGRYVISMEEGYWIHMDAFGENIWKQATIIYPDDDLTAVQIIAEADLPEDAVTMGDTTEEPEQEVMGDTTEEPEQEVM